MQTLAITSRIVANELRKAEKSVNLATLNKAQFLLRLIEPPHFLRPCWQLARKT